VPRLCTRFLFFEKRQNLNFWWYFKVLQANCLWADFGKIWQFWADSAAWQWLMIACPHLKGKKENIITYGESV
jgi:hypothetical protein